MHTARSYLHAVVGGPAALPNLSEVSVLPFESVCALGHEQVVYCHDAESGLRAIIAATAEIYDLVSQSDPCFEVQ